jgi:hypothetical protein
MLSRIFFFGRNGEISSGCVVQLTVRCLSVKELSWCAPSFSPNKSNSDKSSKEMKPAQEKVSATHLFYFASKNPNN